MLSSGARLGPYEVLSPLGAGGMGEVYRARDTKLGRDVALKVLPEAFTSDPDRLARFEREAKVVASLNHPHIAHIYGLEEADGQKALVLELVEGPTLADRIAQGAIPLDEALPIAKQIAEALEAAHEQGIIHRDLKPANVKVRPDGTVKVLDFGLAKAFGPEGSDPNVSQSPTLTARATQTGVILGTAAYMSPEQARGKPVDKRADIWAFGVVLYEMLTGRRPFIGEDVSLTLAEVMKSEPDWSRLPSSTPDAIRRLLRRCLEKSPQHRLHDVADARLEIEEILAGETSTGSGADSRAGVDSRARLRSSKPGVRSLLLWAIGVAFAGAALGFVLGRGGDRSESRASTRRHPLVPTRTVVNLPEGARLALGTEVPLLGFDSPVVALSPDGRHLVYVGQGAKGTRIYHRDLTRFDEPRPIPGTEGALHAFFSPDSGKVGFLTSDRVRKVALDGGTVTTLCRARSPVVATWIGDTIYFTDIEGSILNGVNAEGGEPSKVLDVPDRVGSWAVPSSVLPNGRAALVSVWPPDSTRSDYAEIRILSLEGRGDKALGITGYGARYLPSGHLVFARGGSLMAAPFDLERLELVGAAVPVLTDVAVDPIFSQVQAAFTNDGTVAFVPGRDLALGHLAWVDREGREGLLATEERTYQSLDPSPDDQRVAVQVADVRDYVWIRDVEGGGRDLAGAGLVGWPVWSPDGAALALTTRPVGGHRFEIVRHDLGAGTAKTLLSSERALRPESWVQEGYIGFSEWGHPPPRVGRLSASAGEPEWVMGDAGEDSRGSWGAALSPDGAWIAYTSQEATGGYQVWLEKIGGGTRRQVSTDGGLEPVWCRRCGDLFYRQSNRILASGITLEPRLEIGPPREVFEAPEFVDTWGISFRISADGQRLYYVRRSQPPVRDRIHILQNWFSELERLVPAAAP